MVQFGGLAIMPFALLVLSGQGECRRSARPGSANSARGVAFLLVGAGLHTIQTVGLALATDLAPAESQPKVVGLMYVMLLFGMIASALLFGALLADFTPGRLIQVIQGSAVATIVLNGVALWKQETRRIRPAARATPRTRVSASPGSASPKAAWSCAAWSPSAWAPWRSAWRTCCSNPMADRSCI